ncbi:MAG: universal stress protein [Gemmatimonadales bacterium]|nr:universal stress protein [Gemmatimonadales bacterium]
MTTVSPEKIRRITVALDASASSLAALEAAIELAVQWGAEVEGLFVEDVDLLRWASLPFATEVGHHSGEFRKQNRPEVERQLQALAERAHAHLRHAAERRRVRASFRKVQGNVVRALRAAFAEADLVTLGRGERPRTIPSGLGSTARALAAGRRGLVFVISHRVRLASPVAVLFEDSAAGHRALGLAMDVAHRNAQPLAIVTAGQKREIPPEVRSRAEHDSVEVRTYHVRREDPSRVAAVAHEMGAGILVLSAEHFSSEAIEEAATAFPGALLLVGHSGP